MRYHQTEPIYSSKCSTHSPKNIELMALCICLSWAMIGELIDLSTMLTTCNERTQKPMPALLFTFCSNGLKWSSSHIAFKWVTSPIVTQAQNGVCMHLTIRQSTMLIPNARVTMLVESGSASRPCQMWKFSHSSDLEKLRRMLKIDRSTNEFK